MPACRSAAKGPGEAAKDPPRRLAGRAHPRRDSRGGLPRRALAPHSQGGADHHVSSPCELRRLQWTRGSGQPQRRRRRGRRRRSRYVYVHTARRQPSSHPPISLAGTTS